MNTYILPKGANMSRIAIITDTDSSLPIELAQKFGIVQVPIIIQFGDESFRDIYDITNDALFTRIDKEGKLPTTAAPSPGQFVETFKQAFDSGAESVLCLNISSEMSATYASARQAAEMLPGKRIEVVDTHSLAMGEGYMVLAAAEAVASGATIEEAIAAADDVRSRTFIFGALPTLKYIAMSGRVSSLAAGMAGLLDIKPILTLNNGKLVLLEKIRTQSKAWNRAVELTIEKTAGHKIEKMTILNVKSPEAGRQFESLLKGAVPCPEEITFTEITPGLSVHTGAGMVAVVIVVAK
jgi:DegV family protein with EDD domain